MKKNIIGLSILFLAMSQTLSKPKIYVIGDSTASEYDSSVYPRTGWAQLLQDYFINDSVQVEDKALSGRSSKSFYDEGRWEPIKKALVEGDYVIVQFGHNDEKTDDASRGTYPETTFKQYLSIYIDDALDKGAIPILATPIMRNSWSGNNIKNSHITGDGDYPQAIRDLAALKQIQLIDATNLTQTFFESIGQDSATKLFMNLSPGESPNYPNGNSDNTHLKESGAAQVAQLIVDDIAEQQMLPIAAWIEGNVIVSLLPRKLTLLNSYAGGRFFGFDIQGRVINTTTPGHWNKVVISQPLR